MLLFQLLLCGLSGVAAFVAASRELYIDNTDLARVEVSTSYNGLSFAYGVTSGEFEGKGGLFVSAFKPPAVYFMDTSNGCEDDASCSLTQLVGSGVAGITNGKFTGDGGVTASISDPSRMAFSAALNVVFVMDRTNGLIRYMNLATRTVGTLTSAGQPIQIYGSRLPDNNPELDIKISGEFLYVSDSSWIYNVTGTDGTLAGALSNAVITPYHALKAWQISNGYERTQKVYLTSLAVNEAAGVIYVSYTYRRHAIVVVPIGVSSSADITVLVSDNVLWNPVQTVPISVDTSVGGTIDDAPPTGKSYVTFPMHMQYDADTNTIFFLEVFAHFSSGTILGALGSVAVRRLRLDTRTVDYIAGFEGTFLPIYGKATGYVDGWAEDAKFSYPVSLEFIGSSVSGNGGLKAYVVDSQNRAIRKIESVTDTPHPSLSPTISMEPTRPTVMPTSAPPSRAPTNAPATPVPTVSPTSVPSISLSPTVYSPPTGQPTELNGECLNFVLSDTFGDGWAGAQLRVETPGHEEEVQYFAPTSSDPLAFSVCSSYLRSEQFGLYAAYIDAPKGTEAPWEIRWTVTIESERESYSGDSETLLVFNFDDNGFTFVDSSNMPGDRAAFSCQRCQHPKPKPKPSPSKSDTSSSSYDDDDYYKRRLEEVVVTQREYRNLLPGSKPPPPDPKPPAERYELPFVLHDDGGNGWIDGAGEGSSYFIIDAKRGRVVSEGTLCGESLLKDDCAADLADGDYYFRVTGTGSAADDDVFWTFCRQRGYARQELSFTMIDGTCYPGVLRDAGVILASPLSTKISLSGHLLVENVFGPLLTSIDTLALEVGIQEFLGGGNTTTFDVMVTSTCQSETGTFCAESGDDDDTSSSGRRLADRSHSKPKPKSIADGTSTWDVSILVTLITEQNGVDGTKYSTVVDLSNRIGREITRGVHNGELQDQIHKAVGDSSSISWIHIQREKPSRLVHVNYVSTAPPSVSPLVEEGSQPEDEGGETLAAAPVLTVTVDNSQMQLFMLFAIFGVPALVLAAYFGYRRSYGNSGDIIIGKATPMQKGGWESVVFNDTESARQGGARAPVSRHDSEAVASRSASLPYPDSTGHAALFRKESVGGSGRSVDALLEIPGRAPRQSSPAHSSSVSDSVVHAPISDIRVEHGATNNISPASRHGSVGSARLLPQGGSSQRDRYRVREGIDHHDLSMSSIRSGLAEVL